MRQLGVLRRVNRLREGRDRGTVALLVAILVGSGVLLGCAALTVDVGNLAAERRQIQNGSDAAAIASMQACAKGACPTAADLKPLANSNAADNATRVSRANTALPAICGVVKSPATIAPCPDVLNGVKDLSNCPRPPSLPDEWVRIYTQTEMADGSTILPYYFAQTLTGAPADRTQQTCASAGLVAGYPATVLPVTNSLCSWEAATANGTSFAPLPPYSPAPKKIGASGTAPEVPASLVSFETQVLEQGSKANTTKCLGSNSGQYIPGGFGWLDDDGTCHADINADTGIVNTKPGASLPKVCRDVIASLVGTIVYIPIFTDLGGNGSGGWYRIDGVAAFYLAGYGAPSASPKSFDGYTSTTMSCKGASDSCLWGWYVAPLVPAGDAGDGTDRGPKVIVTLG